MDQLADFLTKNARNWFFLRHNKVQGRKIADSKVWTKKELSRAGLPVPKVLGVLKNDEQVSRFPWEELEGDFVIKPVAGYAGKGIIVVRKRAKWAGEWLTLGGEKLNIPDIRLHCQEILAGRYSLRGMASAVLVEERVKIHPKFLRFTRSGTPDVRVIVYNRVPVMAMLRIPTEESNGKANLDQGAIGLGVDLASGITTYGIRGKEKFIKKIYDLRKKKWIKVNGIKIPEWKAVLEVAVRAQEVVPFLGFVGVDVVLDREKGPQILELNARPGLSIQLCNKAGLKKRLRRVDDLSVRNAEHGIKVATNLFGESFVDRVKSDEGTKMVEVLEKVKVRGKDKKRHEFWAKIDTGALRTSIDQKVARDLGLLEPGNVLFERHYRNAMGRQKGRPVIAVTLWLKGRRIRSIANVADRKDLNTALLIGRQDLGGFLVKPEPITTRMKDSYRLLRE